MGDWWVASKFLMRPSHWGGNRIFLYAQDGCSDYALVRGEGVAVRRITRVLGNSFLPFKFE
jgi:hypothetical protein